ncbi:hypothetical protein G5714_008399 [Onychostoma macrolepis]|uniref:Uncharacterized protein n=1 Tax=Onychostoma macrolepis TaxID=369639 RepID=A0A7J6CVJ9_9TELE|nr:hypothetical protein G5714_008399 [Onychostoma macrolepis]
MHHFPCKGAWQLLREQEGGAGVDGGQGRSQAEFVLVDERDPPSSIVWREREEEEGMDSVALSASFLPAQLYLSSAPLLTVAVCFSLSCNIKNARLEREREENMSKEGEERVKERENVPVRDQSCGGCETEREIKQRGFLVMT